MQALTKTALIDPSDKKANVMSEVFANVMICRDRAIASQLSKLTFPFNPNKRFDCITVEGEYVIQFLLSINYSQFRNNSSF